MLGYNSVLFETMEIFLNQLLALAHKINFAYIFENMPYQIVIHTLRKRIFSVLYTLIKFYTDRLGCV